MDNIAMIFFGLFLLGLIVLDVLMVISMFKTGDERRQLIVWKTSTFTLIVTVGMLIIDVACSIINLEEMAVNPFIRLSVTAMVYFLALLFYKKRYSS